MDLFALVNNNITDFIVVDPPVGVTDDHILGGVTWTSDFEMAAHWLNRRQNYTVLRICNVITDVCEVRLVKYSNTPGSDDVRIGLIGNMTLNRRSRYRTVGENGFISSV